MYTVNDSDFTAMYTGNSDLSAVNTVMKQKQYTLIDPSIWKGFSDLCSNIAKEINSHSSVVKHFFRESFLGSLRAISIYHTLGDYESFQCYAEKMLNSLNKSDISRYPCEKYDYSAKIIINKDMTQAYTLTYNQQSSSAKWKRFEIYKQDLRYFKQLGRYITSNTNLELKWYKWYCEIQDPLSFYEISRFFTGYTFAKSSIQHPEYGLGYTLAYTVDRGFNNPKVKTCITFYKDFFLLVKHYDGKLGSESIENRKEKESTMSHLKKLPCYVIDVSPFSSRSFSFKTSLDGYKSGIFFYTDKTYLDSCFIKHGDKKVPEPEHCKRCIIWPHHIKRVLSNTSSKGLAQRKDLNHKIIEININQIYLDGIMKHIFDYIKHPRVAKGNYGQYEDLFNRVENLFKKPLKMRFNYTTYINPTTDDRAEYELAYLKVTREVEPILNALQELKCFAHIEYIDKEINQKSEEYFNIKEILHSKYQHFYTLDPGHYKVLMAFFYSLAKKQENNLVTLQQHLAGLYYYLGRALGDFYYCNKFTHIFQIIFPMWPKIITEYGYDYLYDAIIYNHQIFFEDLHIIYDRYHLPRTKLYAQNLISLLVQGKTEDYINFCVDVIISSIVYCSYISSTKDYSMIIVEYNNSPKNCKKVKKVKVKKVFDIKTLHRRNMDIDSVNQELDEHKRSLMQYVVVDSTLSSLRSMIKNKKDKNVHINLKQILKLEQIVKNLESFKENLNMHEVQFYQQNNEAEYLNSGDKKKPFKDKRPISFYPIYSIDIRQGRSDLLEPLMGQHQCKNTHCILRKLNEFIIKHNNYDNIEWQEYCTLKQIKKYFTSKTITQYMVEYVLDEGFERISDIKTEISDSKDRGLKNSGLIYYIVEKILEKEEINNVVQYDSLHLRYHVQTLLKKILTISIKEYKPYLLPYFWPKVLRESVTKYMGLNNISDLKSYTEDKKNGMKLINYMLKEQANNKRPNKPPMAVKMFMIMRLRRLTERKMVLRKRPRKNN